MSYERKQKSSKKWILVVLAIAFAGYWFLFRPADIPDLISPVQEASVAEVIQDEKKILVDARTSEEFKKGSLPRAVNVSEAHFSRDYFTLMSELIIGYNVYVFGNTNGLEGENVTRLLENRGIKGVKFVKEGYPALVEARAK